MPSGNIMSRRVTDDQKLEVRRLSDIVEVIGEYVPLKRAGANWKACCPFHEEKSPSFMVSASRQTFRCFGCQVGGDVFEFVMRHEKVEFPEALRMLADRAGVKLQFGAEDGAAAEEKAELYRLCEWAAAFFQEQLGERAGAEARRYVEKRKLDPSMVAEFRLGYAPDAWDRLSGGAKKAGFTEALVEKAGLAIKRESSGVYDRFRNRLIFPIEDTRGRVIGFGGRSLDGSDPKYLNSPETPLFQKGRNLYALPQARDAAMKEDRLAIVEGYTDAIMAHQHGVRWVVATLGTALTRDHIALIRRYASQALAVFDGDEAGKKAGERSLDMFLAEDFPMRIASMPEGLDPCDCLVEKGKDVFVSCLDTSAEPFEYRMALAKSKHDVKELDGKAAAIDEVLASVAATASQVKRDLALRRLAEEFQVKESALRERLLSRGIKGRVAEAGRVSSEAGKASVTARTDGEAAKKGPDRTDLAALELVEVLLAWPSGVERARTRIDLSELPAEWRRLTEEVCRAAEKVPGGGVSDLLAVVSDRPTAERLARIADDGAGKSSEFEKRLDHVIAYFAQCRTARPAGELRAQVVEAQRSSNAEQARASLGELEALMKTYKRGKKRTDGEGR
ncbi:MAG: DNA primase [Planctomycetota bacterium]